MTQSSTAEVSPVLVDPEEKPAAPATQPVTLIEGSTFAVSERWGT